MRYASWIVAAAAMSAIAAWAATGDETVEGIMGADRFIVGGSVIRTEPVAGDFIGAGGTLELAAPVKGDEVVVGGNVRVGGAVGQNLYAAGGRVNVDGAIGRNARVAGGKVQVGAGSTIAGNLTAAGGNVAMRGTVKGYMQAAGGEVIIDGPVEGDVAITSGRLTLGPKARIGGNLSYRGDDLAVDPAASVAGRTDRVASASPDSHSVYGSARTYGFHGGWIWSAGLVLLAALFAAAVPPASIRVSRSLAAHPWYSLLAGFVAIVCIPFAVILLMVTVIGIPLAMVVLLGYLILLVLGYVATAVSVGDAAVSKWRPADAQRSSWRVLAAVVSMLALTLIARIPFVGGLVVFIAVIVGIGAMFMATRPVVASTAVA